MRIIFVPQTAQIPNSAWLTTPVALVRDVSDVDDHESWLILVVGMSRNGTRFERANIEMMIRSECEFSEA